MQLSEFKLSYKTKTDILEKSANIYDAQEKYSNSIEVLKNALEVSEQENNAKDIIYFSNCLGSNFIKLENYIMAMKNYKKSYEFSLKLNDKKKTSICLNNIGNVFFLLENFEKALEYFLKSFEIRKKSNNKEYLANSLNNIGGIYQRLEQFEKSIEKGLKISQRIDTKENTRIINKFLSDYYSKIGNYKEALNFYKKYSEIKDVIHEKNTSKKILELQMNFEIEQQEKEKEIDKLKNIGDKFSLISKDLEQRIDKDFIGNSKAIKFILKDTLNSAKYKDTNVMITGESGTGKEIIARIIHYASSRKDYGFYPINCSAIPETLLESEFFGHKKGTFTGAISDKKGLFELAHKGTLFLDEIADMPLALQAKLLRVIEEKKVKKIGNNEEVFVDVRIIAATNKNIEELIENKNFRLDLYHRINTIIIEIPALRERTEDIEPLFNHFVEQFSKKFNITKLKIKSDLINLLKTYSFPGNVRELKNLVERALIICENNILDESCFPLINKKIPGNNVINFNISQNEDSLIKAALKKTNNNQTEAAKILGISRHTLMRRIAKLR